MLFSDMLAYFNKAKNETNGLDLSTYAEEQKQRKEQKEKEQAQ